MRFLLICALIAICSLAFRLSAQVRLDAKIDFLGNSSVIINYYQGSIPKTDNLKVLDGKFTWEAQVTEAQKITMIFPGRAIYLFIEPGKMSINGRRDSLDHLQITGSRTNDEFVAFTHTLLPLYESEKVLGQQNQSGINERRQLEKQLELLRDRKKLLTKEFISNHPESAVSLDLIESHGRTGSYEEVSSMYDGLSRSTKATAQGIRIAERLAVLKRSAVGERVITFTKNDEKGNPVSFSAFKGKYVLIDFWASWCVPCRKEIPELIRMYEEFKGHNYTVISISLDEVRDRDKWMAALSALKMPWTQLSDLKGWNDDLCRYYGLRAVPSSLLVDPNGNIIGKDLRGAALEKKLRELFP